MTGNKVLNTTPTRLLTVKWRNLLSKSTTAKATNKLNNETNLKILNGEVVNTSSDTPQVVARNARLVRVDFTPKILPLILSGVVFCKIVSIVITIEALAMPINTSHIHAIL